MLIEKKHLVVDKEMAAIKLLVSRYLDNSSDDLEKSDIISLLLVVFAFYTILAVLSNRILITNHATFLGKLVNVGGKVKLMKRYSPGKKKSLEDTTENKIPSPNGEDKVMVLEAELVSISTPTLFTVTFHSSTKGGKNDAVVAAGEQKTITKEELEITHVIIHPNAKRLAWVIALFNALITSSFGSMYVLQLLSVHGERFFYMEPVATSIFNGQTNLSATICFVFLVGNFSDLLFGSLFYKQFVDPLTGWFHHTLFIALMVYVTQISPFYSKIMMIVFTEELPTFLLALGSIWPACRVDLPYGLTFLLFRVIFHIFVFVYSLPVIDNIIMTCFGLTMAMHSLWMFGWFKSYFSKKNKNKIA